MEFTHKSCEQVQSYLDSYVNGELLVETNHEMQKHLNTCRVCARELETRARMKNLLQRAVGTEVAPAELRAKILQQIYSKQPSFISSMVRNPMAIAAVVAFASILTAWLAVAVWNARQNQTSSLEARVSPTLSEESSRILHIGLDDHIHCAIDNGYAIENSGNYSSNIKAEYVGLVPMVEERVGGNLAVVAAHHCMSGDRDFVHLILRNTETTLSVVITKRRGDVFPPNDLAVLHENSGVPLYGIRTPDYAVTGFQVNDHFAFVVSNLNATENARITSNIAPVVRSFLAQSQTVARL